MTNEIERKFFVREMPSLEGIKPLRYERYIVSKEDGKEVRIQKVDDRFTYEEKTELSALERTRTKRAITQTEFEQLKSISGGRPIVREKYRISSNPKIAVQVYHGDFEGLVRAEVEFFSIEEAKAFEPLPWMGREMTGLPIARDAELVKLSQEDFAGYVESKLGT